MNEMPAVQASAAVVHLCASWSLVRISASATPISATATAMASVNAKARALKERLREQCADARAGELGLGDEPACAAVVDQLAVVVRVAARHEHDRRGAPVAADHGRDLEAVQVGQLHVEQHDVGMQLAGLAERLRPV